MSDIAISPELLALAKTELDITWEDPDTDAPSQAVQSVQTKQADAAGKSLSNLFQFCEEVFPEGQELLILVTELTISNYGARFISRYGCKEYFAHNKELLFYERQKEIITELESLDL